MFMSRKDSDWYEWLVICIVGLCGSVASVTSAEHPATEASSANHQETPAASPSPSKGPAIENDLSIGKSGNNNLVFKPDVQYEKNQNADAVKRLESIREIRGSTNQWDEVARLLKEVLSTDASGGIKRNVQQLALLELAGVSEKRGQLAYAQQLLAEYIERYPTDPIVPEILLRQGFLYREMGAYGMAISKFYLVMTAALRLQGNLAYNQRVVLTAQSELAETRFMEGKFGEAAEFYQNLLKQETEELNYQVVKAKLIRALSKSANHSGVIKQATDFLNSYGSSDDSAEIRYLLASAHKSLGEKQQALQQLLLLLEAVEVADATRATKWKSWKMLAGNEIGNQLFLEGDYIHAVQVYKGLLGLDESLTWKLPIHYQIGLCFEHLLQTDEALKTYAEILSLGKKGGAKLDENLEMVVAMAQFRNEVLTWTKSVDRTASTAEKKVAEKTN